jgi:antirestriction protein ArdC
MRGPGYNSVRHRLPAIEGYFAGGGQRVEVGNDRTCHTPAADLIRLPTLALFEVSSNFYAGGTGPAPLSALGVTCRAGSEEPIAKLATAFWGVRFGIDHATRTDHSAYRPIGSQSYSPTTPP